MQQKEEEEKEDVEQRRRSVKEVKLANRFLNAVAMESPRMVDDEELVEEDIKVATEERSDSADDDDKQD